MKYLSLLCAALALAGCAQQQLQNARASVAGQPVAYQDGYTEGCSSGKKAAGNPYFSMQKDAQRFAADNLYQQGWTDGFNVCKGEYDNVIQLMQR